MTPEEYVRLSVVEKIQRDRRQGLRPDRALIEGLSAFLSELVLSSRVVPSRPESSLLAGSAASGNAGSASSLGLAMSRKDAAAEIGVSIETLDRLIVRKQIAATKAGRRVVISREAIEHYLRGETA